MSYGHNFLDEELGVKGEDKLLVYSKEDLFETLKNGLFTLILMLVSIRLLFWINSLI